MRGTLTKILKRYMSGANIESCVNEIMYLIDRIGKNK